MLKSLRDWLNQPVVKVELVGPAIVSVPLTSNKEAAVDTFVEWFRNYWGKQSIAQSAVALRLRESTIQGWVNFVTTFIMSQMAQGKPMPSVADVENEWHKDHPPATVISTPFGDTTRPVTAGGGTTLADLIAEIKETLTRFGG